MCSGEHTAAQCAAETTTLTKPSSQMKERMWIPFVQSFHLFSNSFKATVIAGALEDRSERFWSSFCATASADAADMR